MIIGSLGAIFILYWFYRSAPGFNRKPLNWAVTGVSLYFIIALLWTYFVNPDIKDAAMHNRNTLLMYISKYAYIVIAFTTAFVFNLKVGPKQ